MASSGVRLVHSSNASSCNVYTFLRTYSYLYTIRKLFWQSNGLQWTLSILWEWLTVSYSKKLTQYSYLPYKSKTQTLRQSLMLILHFICWFAVVLWSILSSDLEEEFFQITRSASLSMSGTTAAHYLQVFSQLWLPFFQSELLTWYWFIRYHRFFLFSRSSFLIHHTSANQSSVSSFEVS